MNLIGKYCLGIGLFLFNISVFAQEIKPLKINRLNDKLYVYTTYNTFNGQRYSANALYLITKLGIVLFDTPWDTTQYQPLLDSIQNKHKLPVIAVFTSHWHDDRAGGFTYYNTKGVPTYATPQTNFLLKKNDKEESTRAIKLSKTYKIGGERFKIEYFGEGHTKDNVVVWLPDYHILYGGCLIKSAQAQNIGFVGDGNLRDWPITIGKLMKRHPNIALVIPGHDEWSGAGHLERTLELLKGEIN